MYFQPYNPKPKLKSTSWFEIILGNSRDCFKTYYHNLIQYIIVVMESNVELI